ncbi:tRNA(Ile)-lysidine synthetase [Gracilaria domingensis]|nr:tRNA(Ile)-lysidine synthetase [Gracilaria domingensis]
MLFASITNRLRRTLARKKLLPRSKRLLIAVSGGQDSLSLVEVLKYLHSRDPWEALELAHCDHKWPADVGNPEHVACYAKAAGLPLHILPAEGSIPLSENAAREWRYESLGSLAERNGFTHVVTAHTATDLAETVLFNLSNGSGADGLSSLSWSRPLAPSLTLVRPFLDVTREETASLCMERGIAVWSDVYNDDLRYARNRIRSCVFPAIRRTFHARAEQKFAQSAHLLRDEADYLRQISESVMRRTIQISQTQKPDIQVHINRHILASEHKAIQRRVIRMTLEEHVGLSQKGATFVQVEEICDLLKAPIGKSSASLTGHAQASVVDDELVVIEVPGAFSCLAHEVV